MGGSTGKAVKDCSKTTCVGLESREGVCPGVALMDDNVEGESNGEIELFLKENGLTVFDVGVGEEESFGARGGATCGGGGG